jgi:hypothetical protein
LGSKPWSFSNQIGKATVQICQIAGEFFQAPVIFKPNRKGHGTNTSDCWRCPKGQG